MAINTMFNVQLLYAIFVGASIGSVAGYIGSLMITKRMALMGGALGHLALPGVALGFLYGFDISIGALIFLLIGIFLIWIIEKWTEIPFEATTAVVFTSSLAIAFLFLPHKETNAALLGDISQINFFIAAIYTVFAIAIFFTISLLYKKIILMEISQDMAYVEKIPVSRYNLIYLLCIALVIALGVRIIGGLMTAALVSIPAASSKNISSSMKQYATLSFLFGGIACVIGIIASHYYSIATGPLIIISSTIFFIISLILKKR